MIQSSDYIQTGVGGRYTCVTTYDLSGRVMPETYSSMTFITRQMFDAFMTQGVSIDDLSELSSYSRLKTMSQNTHIQLLVLNQKLFKFFYGYEPYSIGSAMGVGYEAASLSSQDPLVKYAVTAFSIDQMGQSESGSVTIDAPQPGKEPGTFYEIFPTSGQRQLIVVEKHFLNHLTQSKDSCKAFVLAYLSHLDHFGLTNVSLNELYLKLLFVEEFHKVLTLRA